MLAVNAAAFVQSGESTAAAAAPYARDAQAESSGDEALGSGGPRRRFVKPTVTAYEHNFSRNAAGRRFHRRAGAQPRVGLASYSFLQSNQEQNDAHAAAALALADDDSTSFADLAALAAAAGADEHSAANPPSTAMVATKKAAPRVSSLSSVLNEVMHGRQRALSNFVDATAPQHNPRRFVVQQDPHDGAFFVSSSNNPKYAAPPARAPPMETITSPTAAATPAMRRSDLDDGARKSSGHRKWPLTRRSLSRSKERDDDDARSPTKNVLSLSSIKSKLQAARSRNSMTRDAPMTLDEMEDDAPALLGGSRSKKGVAPPLSASRSGGTDELPMLDPDLVDSRARGDSSWEVPPPTHQPLTPAQKQQIVNRPLPYQSGGGAFNADEDEDEEDDNPLNRSFLNVRDIEFNPRTHEHDSPPVSVPADTLDKDDSDEDDGAEDEGWRECTTSSDAESSASSQSGIPNFDARPSGSFSGSGSGSSIMSASAPVGPTRTSVSNANVSEFLGGFKGGFANRTRSMRNNRKSAATQAATVLTRKLRDARSRIPLEFRDDAAVPLPRKKASKKLRVRWDAQLDYVREFEVESEEETEPEIVKAPWEYDEDDLAEEARENREDDDDDDDEWQHPAGNKW